MSELRKRVRTYNWGTTASNLEGGEERRGEERRGEERRGEERRGEERRGEERRERKGKERKGGKTGKGKEEKGKVGTKQQLQHKIHHLMELLTFISPEVYCDID